LGKLGQSECDTFSVIDLNSAFHSLWLSEASRHYICPYAGSPYYIYNRLPQGMNISPGIFQEKCVNIHDDILVFSKKADHANCMEQIFQALQKYGLRHSTHKSVLSKEDCIHRSHYKY
jgi:hypothetical protein